MITSDPANSMLWAFALVPPNAIYQLLDPNKRQSLYAFSARYYIGIRGDFSLWLQFILKPSPKVVAYESLYHNISHSKRYVPVRRNLCDQAGIPCSHSSSRCRGPHAAHLARA